jgi:hypothetical protein
MQVAGLFRPIASIILVIATLLVARPAVAALDEEVKAGRVLADNGFRPQPNGFGFENWGGSQYPYSDLTAADAAALFGERVCARMDAGQCVPTPAAKLWIQEMNQMMEGGHCEGMAALSAAFHVKTETPNSYGANLPFALQPADQELLRTISTYFVTQTLEPVQSITAKTRGWTLQAIVDYLVQTISAGSDYPTLGIYGASGGHAITPYMVVQRGDGTYRVFVYDNNYPGSENFVDIDVRRDLWIYAGAALNPSEPPTPWQGGAGAMDITLLSDRYEPLECPFCGQHQPPRQPRAPEKSPSRPRPSREPSIASDDYGVFSPNRCSQLQATRKADQKQVRMRQSGLASEVDGASMSSLRGARGCFVRLPFGMAYDLVLVDDGRPSYRPTTELVVFAPGSVYSIVNISIEINIGQSFSFSQSGFSYQAGGRQSPTLRVAGDAAGTNGYYEVSGFSLSDNRHFTVEQLDSGQLAFASDDPAVDSFDIHAEAVGETETEIFDFADIEVGEDGQVMLDVEDDGDIELDIDSDSDGLADEEDGDDDNDGDEDFEDTDDDGDGTPDADEADDFDEDGIPDAEDQDDDNDGDLDATDADDSTEDPGDGDSDNDGVDDDADSDDDNDGSLDAEDADDDNDGLDDEAETDEGDDSESSGDDAETDEGDDSESGGDDAEADEGDGGNGEAEDDSFGAEAEEKADDDSDDAAASPRAGGDRAIAS